MASSEAGVVLDAFGRPFETEEDQPLTEIFIVCDDGVPVAACLDEAAVRANITDRVPRHTRIYKVPVEHR